MSKQYVFISGCPRSGTTAFTRLLNTHSQIAIGMERYKYLINRKNLDKIGPHLFSAKAFFEVKPEETNILPVKNSSWQKLYQSLKPKFDREDLLVGDKVPLYFRLYSVLDKCFQNPKHVFMVRDIADVANSYNARAADPKDSWPTEHNYIQAVLHWNESLTQTWQHFEQSSARIFVCEYEKLFSYNPEYLGHLLEFLGLQPDDLLLEKYQEMTLGWEERLAKKHPISEEQKQYLHENAKLALANQLINASHALHCKSNSSIHTASPL